MLMAPVAVRAVDRFVDKETWRLPGGNDGFPPDWQSADAEAVVDDLTRAHLNRSGRQYVKI